MSIRRRVYRIHRTNSISYTNTKYLAKRKEEAEAKKMLNEPQVTAAFPGKWVCSYLRICADLTLSLLLQLFLNLTFPALCQPIIQASPMAEDGSIEKGTFTLMNSTFTLLSDAEKVRPSSPQVTAACPGKLVCSYLCICAYLTLLLHIFST